MRRNGRCNSRNISWVSIHAPVKDATDDAGDIDITRSFNPRTRKGCDNLRYR